MAVSQAIQPFPEGSPVILHTKNQVGKNTQQGAMSALHLQETGLILGMRSWGEGSSLDHK